jgi:hypothetical protein
LIPLSQKDAAIASFAAAAAKLESAGHGDCTSQHEEENSGSRSLLDEAANNGDVEMMELLGNPKTDLVCRS